MRSRCTSSNIGTEQRRKTSSSMLAVKISEKNRMASDRNLPNALAQLHAEPDGHSSTKMGPAAQIIVQVRLPCAEIRLRAIFLRHRDRD